MKPNGPPKYVPFTLKVGARKETVVPFFMKEKVVWVLQRLVCLHHLILKIIEV
jgi:hypothetical protein